MSQTKNCEQGIAAAYRQSYLETALDSFVFGQQECGVSKTDAILSFVELYNIDDETSVNMLKMAQIRAEKKRKELQGKPVRCFLLDVPFSENDVERIAEQIVMKMKRAKTPWLNK